MNCTHRMPRILPVLLIAIVATTVGIRADVFSNVPEASDYTLIYTLPIPSDANYRDGTPVGYSLDQSGSIHNDYDRVAYYFELVDGGGTYWVYVSMDDFAHGSVQALGLPHNRNNPVAHQTIVNNMNVFASANLAGAITTGTGLTTGNIEMWPGNYGAGNAIGIPGANGSNLDFGDQNNAGVSAGHSCFQIHNHGAGQVIFAYNHWGASGTDSVGIGNRGTSHPDWTFSYNAASYTTRTLQILVREGTEKRSTVSDGMAATVRGRVAEAADYDLLYDMSIPNGAQIFNRKVVPYTLAAGGNVAMTPARQAYYLELDSEWVYVSMDAVTTDASKIGVPSRGGHGNGGTAFQQLLSNMNVYGSAGANVVKATGIATGNIEFWPSNYGQGNAAAIPGASASAYDFGDQQTTGQYGSMQVHNYGATETVFGYNRWGIHTGGNSDLGIGNRASTHTDWTTAQNAAGYTTKRLQVLAQPSIYANVPEAADYRLLYALAIPSMGAFKNNIGVPYTVNNSDMVLPLGYYRVAYYLEVEESGVMKWVYVSMDDFANQGLERLGIPHNADNPVAHQRIVHNMNIVASANSGLTTGTGLMTGNIEMWSSNYGGANDAGIPGANGSTYDFGDSWGGTGAGHGSFQVHNHGAGQTLFGYNRFGGGNTTGSSELGIGNRPTGHPDWTLAANAHTYTVRNLWIMVRERTASVNAPAAHARNRVPEAAQYELVYDLSIPNGAAHNTALIPYALNRSATLPPSLGRIAYYLELDSPALGPQWVFVSADAFTEDPAKTGVPSRGPNGNGNTFFQQPLTNMNVYGSAGANVVKGTGIGTGNIEFWSRNYSGARDPVLSPANATGSYDFGDTMSPSGDYGSMQIHNYDIDGAGPGTAGQTIFAYNFWGNNAGGNSALGIGSQPTDSPDWTFVSNAGGYTHKRLQVLVRPRVYDLVPEAADYLVVYGLEIPRARTTDFHRYGVPYGIDHSADLAGGDFPRIAYYLELKKSGQPMQWVYVSMDAFTQDTAKMGIPATAATLWQQTVSNMNVYASAGAPVTTGSGITTGNIEFWPNSYGPANTGGVPGASAGLYDFGDDVNGGVPAGYGCMQVHNYGASETILAYNAWGSSGLVGNLGIGNNPGPTGDPDWTFNDNAAGYEVANLFVLVRAPAGGAVFKVR